MFKTTENKYFSEQPRFSYKDWTNDDEQLDPYDLENKQ